MPQPTTTNHTPSPLPGMGLRLGTVVCYAYLRTTAPSMHRTHALAPPPTLAGMGEAELDTEQDFSRVGRVNAMLARRLELLAEVERMARQLGVVSSWGQQRSKDVYVYGVAGVCGLIKTGFCGGGKGDGKAAGQRAVIREKAAGYSYVRFPILSNHATLVLCFASARSPRPSPLHTRARRRATSGCCTCWRGGRSSRRRWSERGREARGQRCEGAAGGGHTQADWSLPGQSCTATPISPCVPKPDTGRPLLPHCTCTCPSSTVVPQPRPLAPPFPPSQVVAQLFPFTEYFSDAPQPLFAPDAPFEAAMERARGCFRHLRTLFQELEECRAFELLKGQADRVNYLSTKQVRHCIACMHARPAVRLRICYLLLRPLRSRPHCWLTTL